VTEETKATAETKHTLLGKVRFGTVHFRDGVTMHDDTYRTAVAGQIIMLEASQLGIAKAGDHTWAIWVCDPEDHDDGMVVPGCQIRAVSTSPTKLSTGDVHQYCHVYGG